MSPRVASEIRATIARLQELLAVVEAPAAPVEERAPARMKVVHYARRCGLASKTIHGLCDLGMPHEGTGKLRLVLVAQADAWRASGGAERAREAAALAGRAAAAQRGMQ